MAAEIRETFEVEPVLSKGSEGSFDVFLNGELIFSKFDDGRFPEIDEINGIIKSVILDNGEG